LVEDVAGQAERALVVLGHDKEITAVPLSQLKHNQPLTNLMIQHPVTTAILAELDEPLLVITSHYRFLLMTPRQLLERQSVNVQLADVYMMGQREYLCSLSRWRQIKQHDKLLIVTSLGLARPYPMRVMQENIEGPVPLIFDNQLLGVPVLAVGAEPTDEVIMMTETSRAVRYPVNQLRGSGTQALKCDRDNRVTAVALCQPDDELCIVTADGYGRRHLAEWIETPEKENQKGYSHVARGSAVVGIRQPPFWIATVQRILQVDGSRVPLENSTKTFPLIILHHKERILTLI